MLDLEIGHRIAPLRLLLGEVFTFTQLHTAKGAVNGKAEHHPTVGKLGEFEPLFPEFQDKNLFVLIWELRKIISDREKETLAKAIESARRLPSFFDKLVMVAPVGEDDSKWRMDPKFLDQYREVLKGFEIDQWNI